MLSKEERKHLDLIKQWITELETPSDDPVTAKLQNLSFVKESRERLITNLKWLVTLVEREGRYKARDLLNAVEQHEKA